MIGTPSAINFDGPHPSIRDIWKLEEALAHVEADYDLVLIDCAPSLNALTRTAWAASDRVAVVTEPGLFSVAAADRALRAIEEIRRGLSPRLQPLGIIVNRARVQSLEHQFRIKELRDMFGPLVLSPQLPERTSLQQAQGAAKPLHIWPGDSAQEMAALLRSAARTRAAHGAPHRAESSALKLRHLAWRFARRTAELVGRISRGLGRFVQLDQAGLDLSEHLADSDPEDALSAADQVDDLVVRGAQVDAGSVAHERGLGEVVDARFAKLLDRHADLLEGDAGVEQSFDELEDEDVAEPVQSLRSGSCRTAHGGLDESGSCPVVELTVTDTRGTGRDGPAVPGGVIDSGSPSVKSSFCFIAGFLAASRLVHHASFMCPVSPSS